MSTDWFTFHSICNDHKELGGLPEGFGPFYIESKCLSDIQRVEPLYFSESVGLWMEHREEYVLGIMKMRHHLETEGWLWSQLHFILKEDRKWWLRCEGPKPSYLATKTTFHDRYRTEHVTIGSNGGPMSLDRTGLRSHSSNG